MFVLGGALACGCCLCDAAGASEENLDDVDDADSPAEAAIALLLELEAAAAAASAQQRSAEAKKQLHQELVGMRVSELRRRAVAAGMTSDQLDAADDSETPKAAFMEFLMQGKDDSSRVFED